MKHLNYSVSDFIGLECFDPSSEDKGVQNYLKNHGFIPNTVILGAFWYEELERFSNIDSEVVAIVLPDVFRTESVYWTRNDIFLLIEQLHKYSIEVYLKISTYPYQLSSLGEMQSFEAGEDRRRWLERHQSLLQTKKDGSATGLRAVNLLKRTDDGNYYEDEFAAQLLNVLEGYGFDGYCASDGSLGLRGPVDTLENTDFSDDMLEQFENFSDLKVSGETMSEKAEQVLSEYRGEWTSFWRWRWHQHMLKVTKVLGEKNKDIIAVDAWSRNPVDMLHDFGVDYEQLQIPGLRRVLVQSREANKWRKHREGTYVTQEASIFTLLTHKIRAPKIEFDWFMTVVNRAEYWHAVRDLPQVVERENYCFNTLSYYEAGKFNPVIDGFTVQGYPTDRSDWDWCVNQWTHARDLGKKTTEALGLTLVWSDELINQVLAGHTPWITERFRELINGGVCVHSSCMADDIGQVPTQGYLSFTDFSAELSEVGLQVQMLEHGLVINGEKYSYDTGIEQIKQRLSLHCSNGRIYGFGIGNGEYIIGIENPFNHFYDVTTVTLPFAVQAARPLAPREFYLIDGSISGNQFQVSCPPDRCVLVHVTA